MAQTVTLDTLKAGERAYISAVSAQNKTLCSRLLTMGFVTGTMVEVRCRAPLGDPIQVVALGYTVSLRISEARTIDVVPF